MKFSTSSVLLFLGASSTCSAFAPIVKKSSFLVGQQQGRDVFSTVKSATTDSTEEKRAKSKKENRLDFMKNPSFHRRGFKDVRDNVEQAMQDQYQSSVVNDMKESNFVLERDGVKVHLAKVCISQSYMYKCFILTLLLHKLIIFL